MPAMIAIADKYKTKNPSSIIACGCKFKALILNALANKTKTIPEQISIIIYLGLIFCLHSLHFPP